MQCFPRASVLLVKQHRALAALVMALAVLSMAEYLSEDMLTVIIQGAVQAAIMCWEMRSEQFYFVL